MAEEEGMISAAIIHLKHLIAKFILHLLGWKFSTTYQHILPQDKHKMPKKLMIFGEPHTHNVDFILMQLFFWYYKLPTVRFLINQKFNKGPVGWWMKWMGAIFINTHKRQGAVQQVVDTINNSDRIIVHIPPSGTRKRTEVWRSGFYHIALQANIPVFPSWLDASTKTFGYDPPITLTGNVKEDMDKFRAIYKTKRGFVPANESVVKLKIEDEEANGEKKANGEVKANGATHN